MFQNEDFHFFYRYSDLENIIYKKRSEPVPAYENWRECENLAELASIKNDQNALHMESLVIRERILGNVSKSCLDFCEIFKKVIRAMNQPFYFN